MKISLFQEQIDKIVREELQSTLMYLMPTEPDMCRDVKISAKDIKLVKALKRVLRMYE